MKRVNQLTPQFSSIATHGLFASALRVFGFILRRRLERGYDASTQYRSRACRADTIAARGNAEGGWRSVWPRSLGSNRAGTVCSRGARRGAATAPVSRQGVVCTRVVIQLFDATRNEAVAFGCNLFGSQKHTGREARHTTRRECRRQRRHEVVSARGAVATQCVRPALVCCEEVFNP